MNLFSWRSKKHVFLDYASTTPVDKKVLKKMRECSRLFSNPSALYATAIEAKEEIKKSRQKVADILNVQKSEIIFTSGGTESNNLALLGVFENFKSKGLTPHFVTTNVEHPAILEVCEEITRRGGEVTKVSVDSDGRVNPKDIISALKENTVMVSVMYANNEIGTIQPIHEISRAIKEWKSKSGRSLENRLPYFHTDACQAGLYLPLNVTSLGVDLLTLDGIKMYGPRGAGILMARSHVEIKPIVFGGGQEKGLRSGTENLPAIGGVALALEIAQEKREKETLRLTKLRDYGIGEILKAFPSATLNGGKENRLPNNINVCFPGLDAEFAVISLDVLGVSCSYSSSCRTLKEDSSSYVVESLGKKDCSLSSLRFTLGRESTKSHIKTLLSALKKVVK